jgi:GDP-4-dehydro-6-deoxy-D-mannose reductase
MSAPTWLVTGASGFLGRPLLDLLRHEGVRAVAAGRRPVAGAECVALDLDDAGAVARAVAAVRPAVVVHLAGKVPPASAQSLHAVNVGGTHRLVRALEGLDQPVRLVVAGSAAELGPVPADRLPADESTPCRPDTAYGLSKFLAGRLALGAGGRIEPIVARVFNPIGPGMPRSQAFGRFAAHLAESPGDPLPLTVGDLDARRDLIDARDVAAALVALARRGRSREVYHVGTGRSVRIGDGLDALIARSGRRVAVTVQEGAARGPRDSRADARKLAADTGWSPAIDWTRSVADLLDAAMAQAAGRRVA